MSWKEVQKEMEKVEEVDVEIESNFSHDADTLVSSELRGSSNLTAFKILPPIGSMSNASNTEGQPQPLLSAF